MLNDTIWRDHVCVVFDSYREIPTTKDCVHVLWGVSRNVLIINIVDADTCTLDIANLLKISFYPTREQEEQAILPKPIVTCPPSDGCWSEARRRWRWLADCSDCNEIIPNLQRKSLYCSDTAQVYWFYWSTTVDYHPSQITTSYNTGDVAKVINCLLGSEETMGSYQRWGV